MIIAITPKLLTSEELEEEFEEEFGGY